MTAVAKPYQQQTHYELLEIPPQASSDEIRAAYDRAVELYGPESVAIYALESPGMAEDLRSRLREAIEILSDEDLRLEYDRTIGVAPRPAPVEVLRGDEEDEDAPDQPEHGISEVIAHSEAVDSTHGELRVAYVASAPAPAPAPAPPPAAEPPPPPRAAEPPPPSQARPPQPPPEPRAPEAPPPEPRAVARPPAREAAQMLASEDAIADAEAAMAQVSARLKESPPRPKLEIAPDAEFTGELLRRAREAKGYTIHQVAERTRISSRHIENIEADHHKDLPATVYLRGMLMSLAREIGLDPLRVSKSYLASAARKTQP